VYLSLLWIQFQWTAVQGMSLTDTVLPCSSQDGFYTSKQFVWMERQGKAIVRASCKGQQFAEFIILVAENENRGSILFLSQRPAEFQTIDEGQGWSRSSRTGRCW